MTSAISAITGGLSLIDAIFNDDKRKETDKDKSIEDVFSQILDEIAENIEKQVDENMKNHKVENHISKFGPPSGLLIEGFEYS